MIFAVLLLVLLTTPAFSFSKLSSLKLAIHQTTRKSNGDGCCNKQGYVSSWHTSSRTLGRRTETNARPPATTVADQSGGGVPPALTWLQNVVVPDGANVLSEDPLVYVVPNLLSKEECQAYISHVEMLGTSGKRTMTRSNPPEVSLQLSRLWPLPLLSLLAGVPPLFHMQPDQSVMEAVLPNILIALLGSGLLAFCVLQLVRYFSQQSARTSDALALNEEEDIEFVRPLVDRVSSITNEHPWQQWEAPVVTRYDPGAVFAPHNDASPQGGREWADLGGQRVVTCICYLNTIKDGGGGETSFGSLNLAVTPTQGSGLVFFPANAETLDADDRTVHESLAPMEEKWIVQLFGRAGKRVPPPLGLPNNYGD